MMLLANWRTYVVLLILSLGGWGGWSANSLLRPTPEPVTNTVTVEKVITRTVTVTTKPDGTTTTTTTDTTASTNTARPTPVNRAKWSAETLASFRPWVGDTKPKWSAVAYRRMGETNLWVGGGWDFGNKAVLAAVRVDF